MKEALDVRWRQAWSRSWEYEAWENKIYWGIYSWPVAPRSTGSVGRRNWKLLWASVFHCCGRYYLTCREPTRMSLSTSCIPCEGGLGGVLDGGRGMSGSLGGIKAGTAWGTKNRQDFGIERREVFEVGGGSLQKGGNRVNWLCEWFSCYLRYSRGVLSPGRHVRTRLYFTSESHVHSLLSVFRYGGLLDVRILLLL